MNKENKLFKYVCLEKEKWTYDIKMRYFSEPALTAKDLQKKANCHYKDERGYWKEILERYRSSANLDLEECTIIQGNELDKIPSKIKEVWLEDD